MSPTDPRQPLRRLQMDRARCEMCAAGIDHDHEHKKPLNLRARCHPKEALRVAYFEGVLRLNCHACGELVAKVEVAP